MLRRSGTAMTRLRKSHETEIHIMIEFWKVEGFGRSSSGSSGTGYSLTGANCFHGDRKVMF
jgi:hypothetical protein